MKAILLLQRMCWQRNSTAHACTCPYVYSGSVPGNVIYSQQEMHMGLKYHCSAAALLPVLLLSLSCAAALPSKSAEASSVHRRVTTRSYDAKKRPDQTQIDALVRAVFASPSADDSRATEIFTVTDRKTLLLLKGGNPWTGQLDTAPLVIVIAINGHDIHHADLAALDAGIAAQSVMIRAAELGLATVPMSIAPQPQRIQAVRAALSMPDYVTPHIMVAAGYPAADAYSGASTSYYNEKRVHKW